MIIDAIKAQYEALPYPARDPKDEAKRLVTGSPGALAEINHYVFGGKRDFSRPFRALFAGGGTGDGTIMLAQQLADAKSPGEVVYLDLSEASRRIAEQRARARGLKNITFHTGSLLEIGHLGQFDYIDSCGVLHHLPDPAAGLRSLAAALVPGGGIGLMLYGTYGRSGVYEMQAMLRDLTDGLAPREQIAIARKFLAQLPPTNRFRRNPFLRDHIEGGDAGLYDLLLHPQDRAYTVPEIAELTASAGLAVAAFIEPAAYDPANYLDASLAGRLDTLSWLESCAFAESLAGSLKTHVFYCTNDGEGSVAWPDSPDMIPVPQGFDPQRMAMGIQAGGALTATLNGVPMRFPLPSLGAAILARIDGRRTLGEIRADLPSRPDWEGFLGEFRPLYRALNGLNKLLLRRT